MSFTLQFLGVGGAFAAPTNPNDLNSCLMQSNMVLTHRDGSKMLIDCGSYIPLSAAAQGFTAADFDAVYISHEHADHAGGLEWLALSRFFNPNVGRPKLYCAPPVENNLRAMTIPGLETTTRGVQSFESYFTTAQMDIDDSFHWSGTRFLCPPAVHVDDPLHPMRSYGLVFQTGNNSVWISTDTMFDRKLIEKMNDSWKLGVIFHDCETGFKTGVHAHYDELKTLSPDIKSKMWLYHYDAVSAAQLDAQADGFAGFVQRGQMFDL